MINKVAFVVPYFGKLPSYFPLFLNSVKDKSFDILFFTNINKPNALPTNVKWMSTTFEEVKVLFSQKLALTITISNPYKLCDYKPTYGLCFEDHLKQYDFWGSLDIDTVVGNFEKFVSNKLENIDIYSGVKEYVSGACFMMRNTEQCNTLFKKSKDWQSALLNETYVAFDECGGHYFKQLKEGENIFDLNIPIESFTEVVFKEIQNNGLRSYFENDVLEPKGSDFVIINKNSIIYRDDEYLLLHYIYFKATYYFYINTALSHLSTYYFNSLGNFKNKPTKSVMLFSKNMVIAVKKKIQINLKKIKL